MRERLCDLLCQSGVLMALFESLFICVSGFSWAQRMSAKEMEGTLAKSSMAYTDDLTDLPIKEINKRLEDQPRNITLAVKRKRRTIKNRQ